MKPSTSIAIAALAFAGGLGLGIGGTSPGAQTNEAASAPSASAPSSFTPPADDPVLARVNGVPITRSDVQLRIDTSGHEAVKSPEQEKTVLEALITREALAQRARAAGLQKDPAYLEKEKKLGAQVRGFERQELSELLLERESKRRAPTEESARAFFEQNKKRISTELHILQILRRSEAQAIEARNAIQNGKTFEEVAESLVPGMPEGKKAGDLGFLSFSKIPEPWREWVYDLKPGETSGIIRGPNERFWILKVVEVRENPDVTFESVREAVLADMARTGQAGARAALESEARAAAKVEILTPLP